MDDLGQDDHRSGITTHVGVLYGVADQLADHDPDRPRIRAQTIREVAERVARRGNALRHGGKLEPQT